MWTGDVQGELSPVHLKDPRSLFEKSRHSHRWYWSHKETYMLWHMYEMWISLLNHLKVGATIIDQTTTTAATTPPPPPTTTTACWLTCRSLDKDKRYMRWILYHIGLVTMSLLRPPLFEIMENGILLDRRNGKKKYSEKNNHCFYPISWFWGRRRKTQDN